MHKLGMNLFGSGGGGGGGSPSSHKEMTTSEFLKEAKEFAKTKGRTLYNNAYISAHKFLPSHSVEPQPNFTKYHV